MQNLLNQYQRYLSSPDGDPVGSEPSKSMIPNLQRTPFKFKTFINGPVGSKPSKKKKKVSTIKNYLSDTKQFLKWLSDNLQTDQILPQHITPTIINNYLTHLRSDLNKGQKGLTFVNLSTINRRLSSLRNFGQFLEDSGLLDQDPTTDLTNLKPTQKSPTIRRIITQFTKYLKSEDLSNSTIKNYCSDIKNYLIWAQNNTKNIDKGFFKRRT